MSGWLKKTMAHLEAYPVQHGLDFLDTLASSGANVDLEIYAQVRSFLLETGGGYACSTRGSQIVLTDHNGEETLFPFSREVFLARARAM